MAPAKEKWPKDETEVAAPVVQWFSDDGWDVYQEVQNGTSRVPDLVVVQGPLIGVVETLPPLKSGGPIEA